MNCPKCNAENTNDAKFCQVCGNPLTNNVNQQTMNLENTYVPNMNDKKKKKGCLKSVLIAVGIIFAIIIIIGIASGNSNNKKSSTNNNSVIFCTQVDKDLKPIGESESFSVGSVTVELKSSEKFDTDKVKVTLYKISGGSEAIVDSSENEVNPDWSVVAFPINIKEAGEYRVDFTKNGKDKVGSGKVTIK
ncbi:zinc ribbon domain-containing protein [Clostridium saccharobutylicum]|uniref:Double zinc ribbon n=1 Tax=Clostridium saccharobutylicum TaxID=169679 RepID=A0A1S8N428_CLOSA|nr:zinc ribbon domain-containing protein [Clostridium saccharobutylicum]OOM11148.1 double zinc ribbon [Clostridium saccharobutylicum]